MLSLFPEVGVGPILLGLVRFRFVIGRLLLLLPTPSWTIDLLLLTCTDKGQPLSGRNARRHAAPICNDHDLKCFAYQRPKCKSDVNSVLKWNDEHVHYFPHTLDRSCLAQRSTFVSISAREQPIMDTVPFLLKSFSKLC